jgi:hypothetical protein
MLNGANQIEPNAQYNSVFMGIDIEVRAPNPAAVGLRLRACQGSGAEDVSITMHDGLAGMVGGDGSGAEHVNVAVTGGRYGLDFRQAQPASTVVGARLHGQTCAAIVYEGFETLTAVGVNISGFTGTNAVLAGFDLANTAHTDPAYAIPTTGPCALPLMPVNGQMPQPTNDFIAGMMSFIDSSISYGYAQGGVPRSAFATRRTLYLQNVHVQGLEATAGDRVVTFYNSNHTIPVPSYPHPRPPVVRVEQLVHGERPGMRGKWQYTTPIIVDGAMHRGDIVKITTLEQLEAADSDKSGSRTAAAAAHVWGGIAPEDFPSFESIGAVSVKGAPYNAKGDGETDDWKGIQAAIDAHEIVWLPRGVYVVSRPLKLHQGRKLVGVGRHLTRIVPMANGLVDSNDDDGDDGDDGDGGDGDGDGDGGDGGDGDVLDTGLHRTANHASTVDIYGAAHTTAATPEGTSVLPVVMATASAPADGYADNNTNTLTVLAFIGITVWNNLANTSALHWHAHGGVYRQVHANRANRCGSFAGPGCHEPVRIEYPMQLVQRQPGMQSHSATAGVANSAARNTSPTPTNTTRLAFPDATLSVYGFYSEDCCREAILPVKGYNSWAGALAGPQGAHYRHIKVGEGSSGVRFYHLNCEHGTGEAICEFEGATDVDIYGFKTEGNFVSLWVRGCDRVRLYGTGGCGCSANDTLSYPAGYASGYTPTLYRFENTPNYLIANLMDQGSLLADDVVPHPNEFNETACHASAFFILLDLPKGQGGEQLLTQALERPALVQRGNPL